jgi:CheY-like chemotaxis protein/anti-sigma regulatory factor (Ser/Thr protein kinase)
MQAQMLERGGLDEAKVKKACRAIIRAAQTQTQLIEDLLDVSRIVAGKLQMEVQPVNLIEVIRAAVETVSVLAESKSISIEENFDESIGLVSGDPIRLQQIVWNLLTNAIKFTTKGDKILITLKGQDDKVQIQVIDYGIGITPEFLPKVFNRFTQAENTNTRLHGGLGLGLAIVRHLVEMHYGTVKVDSAGQNKGSTFTVILPLIKIVTADDNGKKTNSSVSIKASSKKLRAINLKGIKILLVEDDNGAREAISDMLSMAGADVRSSASANDAMEMLKEFTPDKLVLDIAMPGENGYSLLKRIRKFIPRNIPAMALTALANDKDREEAFSAGFQMHLTKPVDIDRLTNALIELKDQNHFVHNHLLIH